jgi:hypothetical protein
MPEPKLAGDSVVCYAKDSATATKSGGSFVNWSKVTVRAGLSPDAAADTREHSQRSARLALARRLYGCTAGWSGDEPARAGG